MGLSSTQVSGDHMIDRSRTLLLPGEAEPPPEPPYMRRQKQQQQQQQQQESIAPLKCPRCDSTNTKFCYYNNYNKSQPRHLCKACKRHWTKGGILRNVPVGGGRKNKRLKTSNATTSNTPTTTISATSFTTDSNIPGALQIQDTEFLFSSLSNFECSSSLINPSSYDQFLRGYDFAGTIDAAGESTTTSTIPSMIMTAPSPNTSREFDIPSYWNWNSTIDLNIDWYNPEINP